MVVNNKKKNNKRVVRKLLDFEILNLVKLLENYGNFFTGKVNANKL